MKTQQHTGHWKTLCWCRGDRALTTRPGSARPLRPHDDDDESVYRDAYECARRTYNLRQDERQRAVTRLEFKTTLYLWATGKIHLTKSPKFTTERLAR
ncbi:hypothetical protein Gpo141_00001891 [Globisporangium polare]